MTIVVVSVIYQSSLYAPWQFIAKKAITELIKESLVCQPKCYADVIRFDKNTMTDRARNKGEQI